MKINIQLFAGDNARIKIYSNDGNTLLYDNETAGDFPMVSYGAEVVSTGLRIDGFGIIYTYTGQGTFLGFTDTANSQTLYYDIGDSFILGDSPLYVDGVGITLYVVESSSVTYKKITTVSNNKVQVESAIRDGEGVKISTNYAKKSELSAKEDTSNKVTSIDANSTDTQYPSAKCVYNILGDIETLLSQV